VLLSHVAVQEDAGRKSDRLKEKQRSKECRVTDFKTGARGREGKGHEAAIDKEKGGKNKPAGKWKAPTECEAEEGGRRRKICKKRQRRKKAGRAAGRPIA